MGLKRTNYTVSASGITLPEAYAKVGELYIDHTGAAKAVIHVQASRADCDSKEPLELIEVNFTADKTSNQYEQAYSSAKAGVMSGWSDDDPTVEGEEHTDAL